MPNKNIRIVFGALCFFLLASGLWAQSASLYGESAPDDAAFVRVFNALAETQDIWVGSVQFSGTDSSTSTAYRPVNPGVHAVYVGNAFAELIARDGSYYTVILTAGGPVVHEDPRHTRADQSQLLLYNVSLSEAVDLKTADGSVVVIPDVAVGETGTVSVNPAEVAFAVFQSGEPSVTLGDIGLARGQSYALFAVDADGEPHVVVQQAEVLLQ